MSSKNINMVIDPITEHSQPLEIDEIDSRVKYARRTHNDPEEKEIRTARFLTDHYDVDVIFLPVREIVNMKNPDIMIGREFAELKYVTGNLKAVGSNFKKATTQAQNIILHIVPENTNFTKHQIRNAIYGEIQELIRKGEWDKRKPKSLIVFFEGKLHSWKLYKKTKPQN